MSRVEDVKVQLTRFVVGVFVWGVCFRSGSVSGLGRQDLEGEALPVRNV